MYSAVEETLKQKIIEALRLKLAKNCFNTKLDHLNPRVEEDSLLPLKLLNCTLQVLAPSSSREVKPVL